MVRRLPILIFVLMTLLLLNKQKATAQTPVEGARPQNSFDDIQARTMSNEAFARLQEPSRKVEKSTPAALSVRELEEITETLRRDIRLELLTQGWDSPFIIRELEIVESQTTVLKREQERLKERIQVMVDEFKESGKKASTAAEKASIKKQHIARLKEAVDKTFDQVDEQLLPHQREQLDMLVERATLEQLKVRTAGRMKWHKVLSCFLEIPDSKSSDVGANLKSAKIEYDAAIKRANEKAIATILSSVPETKKDLLQKLLGDEFRNYMLLFLSQ